MNTNIQELYRKVLHESAERWNHPVKEIKQDYLADETLK